MPLHKVKSVVVLPSDEDEDEMILIVPITATMSECAAWLQADGLHPLPVLAITFSDEDGATIARLWNAEVDRTAGLASMATRGSA